MENEALGFIGLGNMGAQMARNLFETGYRLTVYNRTRTRDDPLVRKGAALAETPAAATVSGGVVVTMLANDIALESLALG